MLNSQILIWGFFICSLIFWYFFVYLSIKLTGNPINAKFFKWGLSYLQLLASYLHLYTGILEKSQKM